MVIIISMSGCPSQLCECGNNNERTITTTVLPPGAGTILLRPEKNLYTRGEILTATFNPSENYNIYYWNDSSGSYHLCPDPTIPIWVTDDIQLVAIASWTKRRVHVYWDTNVEVDVPGDALEQSSYHFVVEREVDSIATFSGRIKEGLPPLPPGQVRKMFWEIVSMPTPVGQRWGETSCSVKVEGPSSPTVEPIYLHAGAQVWDESGSLYSVNIYPFNPLGGISSSFGTIYCNRCGCETCSCLAVFPYNYAVSGGVRRFRFSMIPNPYVAFVLWLNSEVGYNLSPSTGYTFEGVTGGNIDFFCLYVPRIYLHTGAEGQGVVKIESGKYTERWGYNPFPFNTGGNCSGWRQEDISDCIDILGNEVKLKTEPCSNSWAFDHWEYYSPEEGEGESGTWVELPGIGNVLTAYMNWWGHMDTDPNRLHVPGGVKSFNVKAVFRKYGVFIVQPENPQEWWPTIVYSHFEEKDYNSIMVFGSGNFFGSLHNLPNYDVFLYSGHHGGGWLGSVGWEQIKDNNQGHNYLLVYLLGCRTAAVLYLNGKIVDLGERWKEKVFNASCFIGFEQELSELGAQSFDTMFYYYLSYFFPHSPKNAAIAASYTTFVDVRVLGDVYLPFCEN